MILCVFRQLARASRLRLLYLSVFLLFFVRARLRASMGQANVHAHRDALLYTAGAPADTFILQNAVLVAAFDATTGDLLSVKNLVTGVSMPLTHTLMAYVNGTGGAYILQEDFEAVPLPPAVSHTVTHGVLFSEVCQVGWARAVFLCV